MPKLRSVKTDEHTISSGHLDVGEGHKVYYEVWGNKKAEIPVLTFHGGPGSQYKDHHKYVFDPAKHCVITFDQRGCGNSLPYGETRNNDTQALIADVKKLLDLLKVKKVYVYGGSWGSTLSLLFNIKFPEYVQSTIVSGVFTSSQAEIDYLDKGLFAKHYPEVWERLLASVPKEHTNNPVGYHYQQIRDGKDKAVSASAKALEELEGPLLIFDWRGYNDIKKDKDPAKAEEPYDAVPYKIYTHYLSQQCFLPDDYILTNAHKITAPLHIVQGRYDMVCPPITAYKVHKAVKGSKLFMTLSSHTFDPENRSALTVLFNTVFL